jgi:hypothetical protein
MYLLFAICEDFAAPIVSQTAMFAKRLGPLETLPKARPWRTIFSATMEANKRSALDSSAHFSQ